MLYVKFLVREHSCCICDICPCIVLTVPFKRRYRKVMRRHRRRGVGMFKRRKFKRRGRKQNWGGSIRFSTRFPGGNKVTQVPVAQTYFTKHPFYLTGTTNALDDFHVKNFQPSALFNVDTAGADAGFAAAMNDLYQFYVVLGFSWRVEVVNLETASTMTLLAVPWPTGSLPTNVLQMEYRPGCKSVLLGTKDGAGARKSLSGYVNTSALFGTKLVHEEEFWGQNTTVPARLMHLIIVMQNNVDDQDWNFSFRVHFQIYTKWFNRAVEGFPTVLAPTRVAHLEKLKERVVILAPEEKMEDAILEL